MSRKLQLLHKLVSNLTKILSLPNKQIVPQINFLFKMFVRVEKIFTMYQELGGQSNTIHATKSIVQTELIVILSLVKHFKTCFFNNIKIIGMH